LLAKPIASVKTAADFSTIMSMMKDLGVTSVAAPQPPPPAPAPVSMLAG